MKYYLYLLTISALVSCAKGPEKFYSKGNYEKAYEKALKDIQSGEKDRTLNTILNNSMVELIAEANNKSEALLRSDVVEDWEEAYQVNEKVLSLYYDGKRYLDGKIDDDIQYIENNNEGLKDDIVSAYIGLGDRSMGVYDETANKQSAQEAYLMYEAASKYNTVLSENNLRNKLEEALIAGTIFIDVSVGVWDIGYKYEIERQFEELEDHDNLFYQVTFDEFNANTDCRLDIEFARLNVSTNSQTRTEAYSEQVLDGYSSEVDTTGATIRVPKYTQVTAEVRVTDETRLYTWNIRVDVDDRNNYCDFRDNQFQVSQEAVVTNYQTQGDERAIPDTFRNNTVQTFSNNDERRLINDLIDQSFYDIERYYFR